MNKHYILQAIDSNGKSVFIDNVPKGKKCGCFCSECKGALIARQGDVKVHHFAHVSGNDSIKCSQTALHLLAKEIIMEEKRIPAFVNGKIEFVSVDLIEQEKNFGDIKPDLYAEYNGRAIAVEIFVSHAVDDEKFAKIQNHKLTTFEINLSQLLFETREEVKLAIYDIKNVRPVYDVEFTEKAIADKKKVIDTNGMSKNIENGVVSQCPMNIILRDRTAILDRINVSVCTKCPFGYKRDDENIVHCVGHRHPFIDFSKRLFISRITNPNITFNIEYWWQISVTENKVVAPIELAEYFSLVTKEKFTVIKQRNKSICR